MEIIDAHIHLWNAESVEKIKEEGNPIAKYVPVPSYLLDDYKKDVEGHNVVQCVCVEAVWSGDRVGETAWLNELAETTGTPSAIVGFCDLSSSNAEDVLKRHSEYKRVKGIRQVLIYHKDKPQLSATPHDEYLTDPNWIKGYALLEKYKFSFEFNILGHQMKRAAAVIRQYPGVPAMIGHCGMPCERDTESMKVWREGLEELAACPNVYCKASGMFATDPNWGQKSIEQVVVPVLEIFGIDRCVFASDFPVDKTYGSFQQLLTALEPILGKYCLEDQKKFYAGNAKTFYRL